MRGRDRLLRTALRERFVVTLDDGSAFDGLLDDVDEHSIRFLDAHSVPTGNSEEPVSVDGWLYVDRLRIAYMQRPGG